MNSVSLITLEVLNQMSEPDAETWFSQCCAAPGWYKTMAQARPYASQQQLKQSAQQVWQQCSELDYLAAFEAHPMIGDVNSLREKFAATKNMASNEQQGAADADESTIQALATANHQYLAKHGFIFIICASGLSAKTMLTALTLRLKNDTSTEICLAAIEQIKITLLRLDKNLVFAQEPLSS